ncbi:hypothetical protein [Thermanaeromonas sp. C210]|nr:hypothetical protein [Thermanaeromonas sp. C210]
MFTLTDEEGRLVDLTAVAEARLVIPSAGKGCKGYAPLPKDEW